MPQVYAIGSLNLDYVYRVPHFLRPGETLEAHARAVHRGGKGLNQTVAMLRAGLSVRHVGVVGTDGVALRDFLAQEGADVSALTVEENASTGHTFIQVSPEGENAILYFPGTNHSVTVERVTEALFDAKKGDFLVLQNEVNDTARWIEKGYDRGLRTVLNPSPFSEDLKALDLTKVYALILNETEAAAWTGLPTYEVAPLLEALGHTGVAVVLLTLGAEGLAWRLADGRMGQMPAHRVRALDTTAAGDTFTGYAVAALSAFSQNNDYEALEAGLNFAAAAAALCVTKEGAEPSVPRKDDVHRFLTSRGETKNRSL